MRKIKSLLLLLMIALIMGCSANQPIPAPAEEPISFVMETDMLVYEVQKQRTLNNIHKSVTVKLLDHETNETYEYIESTRGTIQRPSIWDVREGDHLLVELRSWKMKSTDEIIKREVVRVYESNN